MGATVEVAAAAAVVTLGTAGANLAPAHAADLRRALGVTTLLGAGAVFAMCAARWRHVGEGAAAWAGTATLVLGLAVAARPELAGALLAGHGPDGRFLTALSDAGFLVGPLAFAAGLVPGLERRPLPPLAVLGTALTGLAVLAVVFRSAPEAGAAVDIARLSAGQGAAATATGVVAVVAWIALSAGYTLRGLKRNWLYTWGGLTLFAFALAGLASDLSAAGSDPWSVGGAAVEALGIALAVVACSLELAGAYEAQAYRILDSELDAEAARVRESLQMATMRTRRHDLANAVTAIEGAAMILEREFDRLTPEDRTTLARVLESGTSRLRGLLAQETAPQDRVSLSVLAAELAAEPDSDPGVVLETVPDLVGTGVPAEIREALRQLVRYARHRDPGRPLTVRGERDGGWVVLRVEDRGPEMTRRQRLAAADSANRADRASGLDDGVTLRVAARLARRQGGDLWVEQRPGGGASFGICLPAQAPAPGKASGSDG